MLEDVVLKRPDGALRGTVSGVGPGVLLLHAGGERRSVWYSIIDRLAAAGYRALAFDQRAHGDSLKENWLELPPFGADAAAMLAEFCAAPVIVGASLGGFAAIAALNDPEVRAGVAGLVLVDVVPDPDPVAVRSFLAGAQVEIGQSPLVDDILRRGDTLATACSNFDLPVLQIRAGRNASPGDTARFLTLVPRARVVTIAGAGHLIAREAPDQLADVLLDFLGSDAVRDRRIARYLDKAAERAVAHPGGTLRGHVDRVADALRAAGGDPVLVDAARVHAAYGTQAFGRDDDSDRALLREVVGPAAEALVHLYHRCDRARSQPSWAGNRPIIRDRFSGEAKVLEDADRRALIALTIANEQDVLRYDPAIEAKWGKHLRKLFAEWQPYCPKV